MENIKKSMKYTVASIEYSSIALYSYFKRSSLFVYRNSLKFGEVVSKSHNNFFNAKRKCSENDKNIYIERFNSIEKILANLNEKMDSLEKLNLQPSPVRKFDSGKKQVNGGKKLLLQAILHDNKLLHKKKDNHLK